MQFPGLVPRRTFLARLAAWSGAGAIFPALLSGGKASVPEPGMPPVPGDRTESVLGTPGRPLDRTSAEIFERHLDSEFRIIAGPGTAPRRVHLTKVTRSETITKPGRRPPESTPAFSLIFRGPEGPALLQDTYQVEHTQLGVFPLFLVPIGPTQADFRYQAIFA
jgi:hypothetical protein